MRILVTGATGVVGRRLVPLLLDRGDDVTAVGRTEEKRVRLTRLGATAIELDIFDAHAAARAMAGHDAVINLATHVPHSSAAMLLPISWSENQRIRRYASAALVDAALKSRVSRFVQESFAPIYEDRGTAWIDETWPVRTVRYNASVLDAERSAARFTESGGIGVTLRFAAFYGPDAFHIRDLVTGVRRGWAPLPGAPTAYVSSLSHDDAASAAAAALEIPGGIYNVSDDEPVTRREFVDSLAAALGVANPKMTPSWLNWLMHPLTEGISRSQRISNRKIRAAAKWAPRYPSVIRAWPDVVREMPGQTTGDCNRTP